MTDDRVRWPFNVPHERVGFWQYHLSSRTTWIRWPLYGFVIAWFLTGFLG